MTKSAGHILYFRGLNTRGKDHLYLGPARLRRMDYYLSKAFRSFGFEWTSCPDIPASPLEQQIETLKPWLTDFHNEGPLHLLGHSGGGILARAAGYLLPHPPASIVSIASPHRGTELAAQAQLFPQRHPKTDLLCKVLNYNISERLEIFKSYTSESLETINKEYPNIPEVRYASAICAVAPNKMTELPRWLNRLAQGPSESDGFIEVSSQRWGYCLGEFQLDHLSEIGFILTINPNLRKEHTLQFHRLCQEIAQFLVP